MTSFSMQLIHPFYWNLISLKLLDSCQTVSIIWLSWSFRCLAYFIEFQLESFENTGYPQKFPGPWVRMVWVQQSCCLSYNEINEDAFPALSSSRMTLSNNVPKYSHLLLFLREYSRNFGFKQEIYSALNIDEFMFEMIQLCKNSN